MSHPALSEELLLINFEQRAGVQRNCGLAVVCDQSRISRARGPLWPC